MKIFSLSEAKARLSGLAEDVARMDEEVIITRNGKPAAVLVSPDEYESWKETEAVRADTRLMGEIRAGLKALRSRRARTYRVEDLLG